VHSPFFAFLCISPHHRAFAAMAAQLHLQSHKLTSQVLLQPLGCPGPLLRPHNSSNSRKTAGPAPARAAKQQQPRPVFVDDRGTASFLDWARAQGELLFSAGLCSQPLTWQTDTAACVAHNQEEGTFRQQHMCTLPSSTHQHASPASRHSHTPRHHHHPTPHNNAHAGIEFPKLQPATFEGVRGLAAKNDIAADEIIVSVPRQQALTLPPKQRCPCPVGVAVLCAQLWVGLGRVACSAPVAASVGDSRLSASA
jgi:hypothetical protein